MEESKTRRQIINKVMDPRAEKNTQSQGKY